MIAEGKKEASTGQNQESLGWITLGPDGILAQLSDSYEVRVPQIEMCDLCDDILKNGGRALIEAATGTGKSFAYLIPAFTSERTVIVSTDTIQLQEQLVKHDLPRLKEALESERTFAIAKGKANYLCPRNAGSYIAESSLLYPERVDLAEQALGLFMDEEWDGDRSGLSLEIDERTWEDLAADDTCTGPACPHYDECPLIAAKRKVASADIIVTNHAMYLLHHLLLSKGGFGIFPGEHVWIGDEAHTLPERITDQFGVNISQSRANRLAQRLAKQAAALKIKLEINFPAIRAAAEDLMGLMTAAEPGYQLLSEFSTDALHWTEDKAQKLVSAFEQPRLRLASLEDACTDLLLDPETTDEDRKQAKAEKSAIQAMLRSIAELKNDLSQFFSFEEEFVSYVETTRTRRDELAVKLIRSPIETGPLFRDFYRSLQGAIFTSATLTSGPGDEGWKCITADLGLLPKQTRTLRAESPFDYPRQVTGYVPDTVLPHTDPGYHISVARALEKVLLHTQGRAFVLFTAVRDMKAVYEELSCRGLDLALLIQDSPRKDLLLREFKETPRAVLFGVKSFWTGVDIPGAALSCVVIVKFPFPQSGHPVTQARCQRIKDEGRSDFAEYFLPHCIREMRQGFGRLIRSRSDRGLFVILDNRMFTKGYAKKVASALPPFRCVEKLG